MAKKKNKKWKQKPINQEDTRHEKTKVFKSKYAIPEKAEPPIELETYHCSLCSEIIHDLPSALSHRQTGEPVHFDCVLEYLKKTEEIGFNEKLFYIGKGNFAIAYFENPHDLRKFEIKKLIEWENKEKVIEWRSTISDLYSRVQ
jgi:hypothetical protein